MIDTQVLVPKMDTTTKPHNTARQLGIDERVVVGGVVEHGDERGRTLGFATLNLGIRPDDLSVPDGVFAGYVRLADGSVHRSAISVGRRATFYETRGLRLLEAHLLGYSGDLYDQPISVEIVAALREQVRFDGVDSLVAQLRRDVDRCAEVLSGIAPADVLRPARCSTVRR
jgi:FAD synthase